MGMGIFSFVVMVMVWLLAHRSALLGFGRHVLLLVFAVSAPPQVLVVGRVGLLKYLSVGRNGRSLESPSLDSTQRATQPSPLRSKSQTKITNPIVGWHLHEADASLMQADVAGRAEHDEVVLGVVAVGADLALCVVQSRIDVGVGFVLTRILQVSLCLLRHLNHVLLPPPLFQVLKKLHVQRVGLVYQLKRVAWNRNSRLLHHWEPVLRQLGCKH